MTTSPTTNRLGLTLQDYEGSPSTLCAGCGHAGITHQIIHATFELGLEPHQIAKLSGIGCSSKTPAYFIKGAWGFNAIHGRAAAVCTGVALANRSLKNLVVSGDGDSMSIGLNHFIHLIRRNVPVVYIIEDNGVYALTKGQFSATADRGSALRWGEVNELPPVDPCSLAMELGCGFVARSFSGNSRQLKTLIKAAFAHPGTAVLDVISPCVTWNNHETSSRSYQNTKSHESPLQELGFIPPFPSEDLDLPAGEARGFSFPDGGRLVFRALREDYDPTNRVEAWRRVHESRDKGELLTGLLYYQPNKPTLHDFVKTTAAPLTGLPQSALKPGPEVLRRIMEEFR